MLVRFGSAALPRSAFVLALVYPRVETRGYYRLTASRSRIRERKKSFVDAKSPTTAAQSNDNSAELQLGNQRNKIEKAFRLDDGLQLKCRTERNEVNLVLQS